MTSAAHCDVHPIKLSHTQVLRSTAALISLLQRTALRKLWQTARLLMCTVGIADCGGSRRYVLPLVLIERAADARLVAELMPALLQIRITGRTGGTALPTQPSPDHCPAPPD